MLQVVELHVIKEGKQILRGINLNVNSREKIVILGESGSGKSTLLKSIILFEYITMGNIKFQGEIIDQTNIIEYRKNFVYISQKAPQSFFSVRDYICLPFQFRHNLRKIPENRKINELIQRFTFPLEILEQNYNDLSGGEQQRITLIQALLLQKPIYLLDEITSNLDKLNVKNTLDIILSDPARTILYVTHNTQNLEYFDTVYELISGRLILQREA